MATDGSADNRRRTQPKPAIFASSRACIARGTGSSNPSPSSGESTNLRFLSPTRDRVMPAWHSGRPGSLLHRLCEAEANGGVRSAGRTADMTSDPVHYLSLTDVSERLRRGELTPTALSEMILARIHRHEGALKSYTTLLATAPWPKHGRQTRNSTAVSGAARSTACRSR